MNQETLLEARKQIAGFLKKRREELGISQDKLAELTGLNRSTIKRMEAADFWPGMKQYLILCQALHLFPMVATIEGDSEEARMMRQALWGAMKEGKDMSIDEALRQRDSRYLRKENKN